MATKKKTTEKRFITASEAKKIIDKYYHLKNELYEIATKSKYNAEAQKYAKLAIKALEKWRGDKLNISRMSNYNA